jgi:RNA polymerase sigma-70 factor, ECF subfamily
MKNSKEEKFRQLLTENNPRIRSICNYYARSEADRKDLYQDIITNMWQCLGSFRGDSSIHTWVYRVALNTAITASHKSLGIQNLELQWDESKTKQLLVDDSDSNLKETEEKLNILNLQLNQLSIIDKMLMTLLLDGLSMREIAEIVGITEPNVRVKIHRIKETVRTNIKNSDHE